MQSNSYFIPTFVKLVAPLRKLLNEEGFCWTDMNQKYLMFSDNLFLSFFDMTLSSHIFTDDHKTGDILCQGKDSENLKPVAIDSYCTNQAEKNYAQLDLEAMAIDFSPRRFRLYLL